MTLNSILDYNAKVRPHERALSMKIGYRTKTLNYREVYDLSMKVAHHLQTHGVRGSDKVLLLAPNSPYWVCVYWGTILCGGIIVPLNTQSTPQMVRKIAEQTEARLFIKHTKFQKDIGIQNLKIVDIESFIQEIEELDYATFKRFKANDDTVMQILYTSGTTGDPKGVMLTHQNIYSNIISVSRIVPLTTMDKVLSILPLSHVFEQVVGFLVPFKSGSEIVYAHSPAAISDLLKEHRITKLIAVPEFLRLFMARIKSTAKEQGKENSFSVMMELAKAISWKYLQQLIFISLHLKFGGRLHMIASGGAALDPDLEEEWEAFGIDILQGYGLTETSPVVSLNSFQEKRIGSVGKPLPGVKVKIAEDGEILVKGPNVFKGYFKNKEKTESAFTKDGWFKTDDIGGFDKDGFLYIKGRKKYMILGPGGQNVFPEDIEFEINEIEGVVDSCVLDTKLPGNRIEIHAVLILKDGPYDAEKIVNQANKNLASYQQIGGVTVWGEDDFPRTATGKVKREEVRKHLDSIKKKRERKEEEKTSLMHLLSEITGYDLDDIESKSVLVRELGLDSLLRIELITRIEEKYSVTISEKNITSATTVSDLQAIIDEAKPAKPKMHVARWPISALGQGIRYLSHLIILFPFTMLYVNLRVEGLENLENLEEPFIFMPNHTGSFDIPAFLLAVPLRFRRNLAFAAAADIWYKNQSRQFMSYVGELFFNTFPFFRKEGENIRTGLEYLGLVLDRGCPVAVYPEGRVSISGKLQPLKKGTGLIAVEMDCPIIPVKTYGLPDIWRPKTKWPQKRGRAIVRFGKPLFFSKSDSYEDATLRIQNALENL